MVNVMDLVIGFGIVLYVHLSIDLHIIYLYLAINLRIILNIDLGIIHVPTADLTLYFCIAFYIIKII
jgi:hypothetical protein